mmetsp:Transcript_59127/g.139151  ORF Transcript_59127/g.139151 Transcript_59127/m.139151 type:complete len:125 (+) Transcript_59127:586-960(+)
MPLHRLLFIVRPPFFALPSCSLAVAGSHRPFPKASSDDVIEICLCATLSTSSAAPGAFVAQSVPASLPSPSTSPLHLPVRNASCLVALPCISLSDLEYISREKQGGRATQPGSVRFSLGSLRVV